MENLVKKEVSSFNPRPFVCGNDFCEKSFKTKAVRNRHQKSCKPKEIVEEEEEWITLICWGCHRKVTTISNLHVHLKICKFVQESDKYRLFGQYHVMKWPIAKVREHLEAMNANTVGTIDELRCRLATCLSVAKDLRNYIRDFKVSVERSAGSMRALNGVHLRFRATRDNWADCWRDAKLKPTVRNKLKRELLVVYDAMYAAKAVIRDRSQKSKERIVEVDEDIIELEPLPNDEESPQQIPEHTIEPEANDEETGRRPQLVSIDYDSDSDTSSDNNLDISSAEADHKGKDKAEITEVELLDEIVDVTGSDDNVKQADRIERDKEPEKAASIIETVLMPGTSNQASKAEIIEMLECEVHATIDELIKSKCLSHKLYKSVKITASAILGSISKEKKELLESKLQTLKCIYEPIPSSRVEAEECVMSSSNGCESNEAQTIGKGSNGKKRQYPINSPRGDFESKQLNGHQTIASIPVAKRIRLGSSGSESMPTNTPSTKECESNEASSEDSALEICYETQTSSGASAEFGQLKRKASPKESTDNASPIKKPFLMNAISSTSSTNVALTEPPQRDQKNASPRESEPKTLQGPYEGSPVIHKKINLVKESTTVVESKQTKSPSNEVLPMKSLSNDSPPKTISEPAEDNADAKKFDEDVIEASQRRILRSKVKSSTAVSEELERVGRIQERNRLHPLQYEGAFILNPGEMPNVSVDPVLARVLRPHQRRGVQFLFDNVFESISKFSCFFVRRNPNMD